MNELMDEQARCLTATDALSVKNSSQIQACHLLTALAVKCREVSGFTG
jgi:hypothetical protein